jgi:hypothetical protein
MEAKLGADLSNVTASTSGESAKAADQLGAKAFTVGQDIHFGRGHYDPESPGGQRLIAHELVHTIQARGAGIVQRKADEGEAAGQDGAGGDTAASAGVSGGEAAEAGMEGAEVSQPDEPAEREADAIADQVVDGEGAEAGGTEAEGAEAKGKGKGKRKQQGQEAAGAEGAEASGAEAGVAGAEAAGGEAAAQAAKETPDGAPAPDAEPPPSGQKEGQPGDKPAEGEGAEAKEAAPPIAAKLSGVGRKIFRTATTPSTGPPATPAADPWTTYLNSLPAELKAQAQGLQADEQEAFKQVGAAHQRTFLGLKSKPARLELVGLPEPAKAKLAVIVLNETERFTYENVLSGRPREVYRDLTPDERKDLATLPGNQLTQILSEAAKLDEWRKLRNVAALGSSPQVAADLAAAGENPEEIVKALSTGTAGERLRRVIADPGFANEGDKAGYIRAVKAQLPGKSDPYEAMKAARPGFLLRGKPATGDPNFERMPIMKAFPLVNVWKYGTVPDDVATTVLETAPPSDKSIPRGPDGKVDRAQAAAKMRDMPFKQATAPLFARYIKSVGSLAGCDLPLNGGPAVPMAYWMYDEQGLGLLAPDKSPGDVSKVLAVDENPDYQLGFAVVSMPPAVKQGVAAAKGIRRPTAIDGLTFDQFALADPSACYGVTSGGMNEVVVSTVQVSQTKIERIC